MTEFIFKAYTLQLLNCISENDTNKVIFINYNSPNHPERLKLEAKIVELRNKLKAALKAENYCENSIISAILTEQNQKFVEEVDNMGV
jgi:hypothetical protein